jgi:predicted Zn-dependent protease
MPSSSLFTTWSRACVIVCAATVAIADARAQGATGAVRAPATPTVAEDERVADSLFRAGALDAALAAYRGLKAVPAVRVPLVRLRVASLLGWTGKTREAADAWRAYVRDYPKDSDGRVGLATAHGWIGEVDGAIAQLDTVLARPGGSAAAQAQRIRLLTRAARRDEVERACANAGVAPLDSALLGACG